MRSFWEVWQSAARQIVVTECLRMHWSISAMARGRSMKDKHLRAAGNQLLSWNPKQTNMEEMHILRYKHHRIFLTLDVYWFYIYEVIVPWRLISQFSCTALWNPYIETITAMHIFADYTLLILHAIRWWVAVPHKKTDISPVHNTISLTRICSTSFSNRFDFPPNPTLIY